MPNRHELLPGVCVHGHFNSLRGFGVRQYYPEADQFIAFLRDPFERFLSQWFYLKKSDPDGSDPSHPLYGVADLEGFFRKRVEAQPMRRDAYSMACHFPQVTPTGVFSAEAANASFVFVGILERYQASLDALASALGKPRVEQVVMNKAPRVGEDFSSLRRVYERYFEDEYEIYEWGRRVNAEALKL